MNRILIFVHYNKNNSLSDYVLYLLYGIRKIFATLIVVSNSLLEESDKEKLKPYADKIVIRDNKGFDFGAWKEIIFKEGFDFLSQFDSLTLMNDTCFGPFMDIENIYLEMEKKDIDFWGITNRRKTNYGLPGYAKAIPAHIQSYFIVFNKNIITSTVFKSFWQGVENVLSVYSVITKYEASMTEILEKAGFKYKAYVDTNSLNLKYPNAFYAYPDLMIKYNSPFIKVKSFLSFQDTGYLKNLIEQKSNYPIELIDTHISEYFNPNISLSICNKIEILKYCTDVSCKNKKVAIHIHINKFDDLALYIDVLKTSLSNFDLFITSEKAEETKLIEECLIKKDLTSLVKEIAVLESNNMLSFPWLKLSEKIMDYDVVGYFNNYKIYGKEQRIKDSIFYEVFENIFKPLDQILYMFEKNDKLGIIISDIPIYFCKMFIGSLWNGLEKECQKIWNNMVEPKDIKFKKLKTPIFPYNFMFWYKPKALKPLFDLKIHDEKQCKLLKEYKLSNTIEKLPIYVAWNQGYDYRIAVTEKNITSGFSQVNMKNKYISYYKFLLKNKFNKKELSFLKKVYYLFKKK